MVTITLISGASGSGKSTIAKKVAESIGNKHDNVKVLKQDDYFTAACVPYHQRQDVSFENGFGIDWDSLIQDIEACAKNDDNSDDSDSVIIVEGHIIGNAASKIFNAFDGQASIVLVFIECSSKVCKRRRLGRQERSEQEYQDLHTYIDQFVWPCFIEFGLPAMESLKRHGTLNEEKRGVAILDIISTDGQTSLDDNVKRIAEAICNVQSPPGKHQHEQDEVIEEWPSLAGDLRGFAQHEILSVKLDHNQDASFELECVSSLSLLDMVNLSHGSHDATGHSVWMGAFLLVEALASNVTFTDLETKRLSLGSLFQSKIVLELGCGTGLGGLSLLCSPDSWLAKPSHLAFSDNDAEVLALCQKNCIRQWPPSDASMQSSAEPVFSTFSLDWGDAAPKDAGGKLYDTILATDVIYDLACLEPLLSTVTKSLRKRGFFVLAHVPRSCLPEIVSETNLPKGEMDYNALLEHHIMAAADELGLQTLTLLRPDYIRDAIIRIKAGTPKALNSTSLFKMEEAGASIFVFQRTAG